MRRRDFILQLGGVALTRPLAAAAQEIGKNPSVTVPRVGVLHLLRSDVLYQAFVGGLAELRYKQGKNIILERRDAEGQLQKLALLARELATLKVDVLVAMSTPAARALKNATTTTPIVFTLVADPIGDGIVASLSRPGGNITGLTNVNPELMPKRVEVLLETFPGISRIAVLFAATTPGLGSRLAETKRATKQRGKEQLTIKVERPEELDLAFKNMLKERADALVVLNSPMFFYHRKTIVRLANKNHLPAIYDGSELVESGGLMSYGANFSDLCRGAAGYVDKILKGAKPQELPVEQPTNFELVINQKTAKDLGLTIPRTMLQRADRVIE